jgi:hypothetical protein
MTNLNEVNEIKISNTQTLYTGKTSNGFTYVNYGVGKEGKQKRVNQHVVLFNDSELDTLEVFLIDGCDFAYACKWMNYQSLLGEYTQ